MMFICDYQDREAGSFLELCRSYGVSRVTGYKWVERFETGGLAGLEDRSRAPHGVGHGLSPELETLILKARETHPSWGARKLLARLKVEHPEIDWCVTSTVGRLLRRHGETQPPRFSPKSPPRLGPLRPGTRANEVWCTDFKGWFGLGGGRRCEPWTLTDEWSRYLLRVVGMENQAMEPIKQAFARAFKEYGMPEVIRSDNGQPFAGTGVGGLSRLSVWWIKMGIVPERIRRGKPQENGKHERMHRTLLEAIQPPAKNLKEQQRRFDAFRREFNQERPHQALGDCPPAQFYEASPRQYPGKTPKVEYGSGLVIKRVQKHGDILWNGRRLFLNQALADEPVAFEPLDDPWWLVRFATVKLAKFNAQERSIYPLTAEDLKGPVGNTLCPREPKEL